MDLLESTAISTQKELAKVGTKDVELASLVAPDTNFPFEMLALIASFIDKPFVPAS